MKKNIENKNALKRRIVVGANLFRNVSVVNGSWLPFLKICNWILTHEL